MESFESIASRARKILEDVTKQMEKIVTERTNLLLDYIEKFINQTLAGSKPAVRSSDSQSLISNDDEASMKCESLSIDVEVCVPYINYLENKQRELKGLGEVFDIIKNYFMVAKTKCDIVASKDRCRKLMVS